MVHVDPTPKPNPAPRTLSSLHTGQTGPRHTGQVFEVRSGRQAALSKAFPVLYTQKEPAIRPAAVFQNVQVW